MKPALHEKNYNNHINIDQNKIKIKPGIKVKINDRKQGLFHTYDLFVFKYLLFIPMIQKIKVYTRYICHYPSDIYL